MGSSEGNIQKEREETMSLIVSKQKLIFQI